MEIGKRIKELRGYLKLTQEQFAKPLGVDRGHIAGIETGSRNPSEPLMRLIQFIYCVNETWLKTGEGEMFVSPEEVLKHQVERFGERAVGEAFYNIMKGYRPAWVVMESQASYTPNPELTRMIETLKTLWSTADDAMKGWIKVQFARAFPADVVEEAQKKQKETTGEPQVS